MVRSPSSAPGGRSLRSYGRDYVIPDDVKLLAPSVLEHRVIVTPEAGLRSVTGVDVIEAVVRSVPVPGAAG